MTSRLTSERSAMKKDNLGAKDRKMKNKLTLKRGTVLASLQGVLYLASKSSSVFKAEHCCVINTLVCLFKKNLWLLLGG